jgi:NTE family protein
VRQDAFDIRRDICALRTRLFFDQLDSVDFPRDGYRLDLQVDSSSTRLGASRTYNRWIADALKVVSSGANSFQFAVAGGGAVGGAELPLYDYLSFGGFLRMTGYKPGQLRNDSLAYGRFLYSNQLVNLNFLDGVYAGVTLEAARLGKPLVPGGITGSIASVGLFLAIDTPLGPAYLGYGRAQDGNNSAYFFLGRP